MSSVLVMAPQRIADGDPTLTVSWAAAPVIAWAVFAGWRGGAVAAVVAGGAAVAERRGAGRRGAPTAAGDAAATRAPATA